jgi:hypothetical protein
MSENLAQWQAYCFTCKKRLNDPMANGIFAQAYGERHLREYPEHDVMLGFRLNALQIAPQIIDMLEDVG